ncbi:MAG: J domain-containing protein [Acidobacteriaceae bacterium]|jgi:hypothetical protein
MVIMDLCECGSKIDEYSNLCARCAALQALNLASGATDKDIKTAYRLLVKVWHPDLFESDKRAKASAEEKMCNIIAAFRLLSSRPCDSSSPGIIPEFFTIGSTKNEVLAVQGVPTAYSPDTFEYGRSKVFFVGDKVVGWEDAPLWIHLNVRLRPCHAVDGGMHYFTIGSTRDEVLAVQGTPTGFSHNTFEYGTSKVHFRDGRVSSWDNSPAWIPLKVQVH